MIEKPVRSIYYWALALEEDYWEIIEITLPPVGPAIGLTMHGPAALSDFHRLIGPIEPPEDDE